MKKKKRKKKLFRSVFLSPRDVLWQRWSGRIRRGRDSTATRKNKYHRIKNDTSAAFVLVVGILKVFGKHISGSYSSLIAFLKENKLKHKASSSLLSCLVQFLLPSVGVRLVQLEAGSCSPCDTTRPITAVRCHGRNLGVTAWICSGIIMCNAYAVAEQVVVCLKIGKCLASACHFFLHVF